MRQFVKLPGERGVDYTPIAFQLLDDFTGASPIGRIAVSLQEETVANQWRDVDFAPVRSAAEVFTYPGLGRTADLTNSPRTHRAVIDSDYYEANDDIEFLTNLYNDDHPLQSDEYAQQIDKVTLIPNAQYPYESHVPCVRGKVTNGENGQPFPGVELQHQSLKVFSNSAGEFALPVRFPAQDTSTTAVSERNRIKVKNARGYFKAELQVVIDGKKNSYRMIEFDDWKDKSTPPKDHEATLILGPLSESDNLPAGLPAQTSVSLVKFALFIDTSPLSRLEIYEEFYVDRSGGFQKFHRIVIPSP